MKIRTMLAPALAAAGLLAQPALAQDSASSATLNATTTGTPAATPPAATSDAVRDALAKKEGDADNTTLLKETLTAVDKQYSLIRKGKVQLNYELGYTYIGQEKINTDLSSGTATLFSIENTNSHTIGDLGLGVRWQPQEVKRDEVAYTITGGVRLATGTSPYKVDINKGLATGSGVNTFNIGANMTRIVDPVALFGSLNFGYGLKAKHLNQQLYGNTLHEVKPGASFGFGLGFAYALSYKITTSFAFQESIQARSTLTLDGGTKVQTQTQSAGILSIGAGYRMSPKTTVNVTVGAGLTAAAPNLSLTMSLPLAL